MNMGTGTTYKGKKMRKATFIMVLAVGGTTTDMELVIKEGTDFAWCFLFLDDAI